MIRSRSILSVQGGCTEHRVLELNETDIKVTGPMKSGGHDLVCFVYCSSARAFCIAGARYLLNE